MNRSLSVFVALALVSAALFASDAPPPTHLQKGEWSYHSVIRFTSGPMAGRTASRDWKVCVKDDREANAALMPHPQHGDTTCSRPTLSHDRQGYHTAMSCETRARGMTSKVGEDFLLVPGDKGDTFEAHGKVDQQLLITSMPARDMHMTIDVSGRRTGACGGG